MNRDKTPVELKPGAELPLFSITPTHAELFMFSAVTWNRHHVHYNKDAAVSEGLPDVVVHRALLGNYLCRFLENWAGHNGTITALEWKVLNSAVPGDELICSGHVDEVVEMGGGRKLICGLSIDRRGDCIVKGTATVELPL